MVDEFPLFTATVPCLENALALNEWAFYRPRSALAIHLSEYACDVIQVLIVSAMRDCCDDWGCN